MPPATTPPSPPDRPARPVFARAAVSTPPGAIRTESTSHPMLNTPLSALEQRDDFLSRHIGPNEQETAQMLAQLGAPSLDALIAQTVPAAIRLEKPLPLAGSKPEHEALADLKAIASKNII